MYKFVWDVSVNENGLSTLRVYFKEKVIALLSSILSKPKLLVFDRVRIDFSGTKRTEEKYHCFGFQEKGRRNRIIVVDVNTAQVEYKTE